MATHREMITHENRRYLGDVRRFKNFLRVNGQLDPCYVAFMEGQAFAEYGASMPRRLQRNHYPAHAKARRAEWERGYNLPADPTRNV